MKIARQALETFRRALVLGAETDRPTDEEIVRVRMALFRAQADLFRFSGARRLADWTDRVENFNAAYHLKVVPLREFMEHS
ncbi:MAG: hypothetical protein GY725_04345 [bacterium]|nr:hypothetical protein [bacterium]